MFPIIQAKPEYLSDIYKLIIDLARYHDIEDKIKITESQLADLLFCNEPTHFVGMAIVDGELAGLVFYNFTNHNICFNVIPGVYIENLYVSPKCRNQGIGRSLFNYVIHKARENECSRIEWWVSKENKKASNFYKKLGASELSDWCVYKFDTVAMDKLLIRNEL